MKNKLLEIRLGMGYKKQKDFAEFLGLKVAQYNKFENNKDQPTLDGAFRICEKLGKNINEVFYYIKELKK